jgi:hypothetical protein
MHPLKGCCEINYRQGTKNLVMQFCNTRYSYNNFSVIYFISVAVLCVNNFKHSYPHIFIPIENRKSVYYVMCYMPSEKSKSVGYFVFTVFRRQPKNAEKTTGLLSEMHTYNWSLNKIAASIRLII